MADERRSPKRKAAASRAKPPGDGESLTLFAGDDDNIVPGSLIVKLSPEAAASITASIPTGPLGRRP